MPFTCYSWLTRRRVLSVSLGLRPKSHTWPTTHATSQWKSAWGLARAVRRFAVSNAALVFRRTFRCWGDQSSSLTPRSAGPMIHKAFRSDSSLKVWLNLDSDQYTRCISNKWYQPIHPLPNWLIPGLVCEGDLSLFQHASCKRSDCAQDRSTPWPARLRTVGGNWSSLRNPRRHRENKHAERPGFEPGTYPLHHCTTPISHDAVEKWLW